MTKAFEVQLEPKRKQINVLRASAGTTLQPNDFTLMRDGLSIGDGEPIRIKGAFALPRSVVDATIVECGGKWFVDLTLNPRVRHLPPTNKDVGVDLGVKDVIVTSDGLTIESDQSIIRLGKQIDKLKSRLKRLKRGSNRHSELKSIITRKMRNLYHKQVNQANHVARVLVENYDTIYVEDVNTSVRGIRENRVYNKAVAWTNWELIIKTIEVRAYETGRRVMLVPPWWSSQTCPRCDWWTPKSLDSREHRCEHCGYVTTRDKAAAEVILSRGRLIDSGSRRRDWHPRGHPNHRH